MTKTGFHGWRVTILETVLYRLVLFFISLLPRRVAYAMARRLGRSKYRAKRRGLQPQLENLSTRLQLTEVEANSVLERSFELEASEFLDGALCRFRPKANLLNLVEVRGLENLSEALREGKGAILYSGHVRGNFSFFAALGLLGYKPNPVRLQLSSMQHPVRRWFGDRFDRMLIERFDCRFLWTRPESFGVAVQGANALRRNEVVLILMDLSFSAENVEVDFLGGPARFPLGPALLAKATGAPLLDYYVHRDDDWIPQRVEIGPPLAVADDPQEAIQECAARLEEYIRRHPDSWSPWLINDWKLFATWGEQTPWTFFEQATNRF